MPIASFWKISLFLCFFALPLAAETESAPTSAVTLTLKGTLFEMGTRTPLSGFNIYVFPSKLKGVTDEKGQFTIDGVPEGEFAWLVNAAGYYRLEKEDSQRVTGPNEPRKLFLRKFSYDVYETTIFGKQDKRESRGRSLSPMDMLKAPGANEDPIKAVQNLPGVARPAPFTGLVAIEGSAPQDTAYLIDGHELPLIFHFGGLTSVVFPETLARVDYLASGFGPEYGRALGGQIGAVTRPARTDRFHGLAFADLFHAGLLLETPIGKGGLYAGVRRSYIGDVLKLVAGNNPDFDLTVAPAYGDLLVVYDTPIGDASKFRLVGIGSQDALKFLFDTPVGRDSSGRGSFSTETNFFRLIPQWESKVSPDLTTRFSAAIGKDAFRVDILDNFFEVDSKSLTLRGEGEYRFSPLWTSALGTDSRFSWSTYSYRLPDSAFGEGIGTVNSPGQIQSEGTPQSSEIAFYLRNTITPEGTPWTFLPGARVTHYNVAQESFVEPRLGVRYKLDDSWSLRASVGAYSQAPQPQQIDETLGNPAVKSERAWHYTVGTEKDFRNGSSNGFSMSSDFFFKQMDSLVIPSSALIDRNGTLVAEKFTNRGTGKAFGVSSSLKYDGKPVSGSLSYTIARSTRAEPERGDHLFQYDQTHVLTVLGQIDMGNDVTISSRFRFVSGNPHTPVRDGVFSSDSDSYRPIYGPFYSERVSPFVALDVRIDKKWIYDTWMFSVYLDVQNVTNQRNAESIRYSYDFRRSESVAGLPMLPTLGIKGEF